MFSPHLFIERLLKMTHSLALKDGDLHVSSSRVQLVSGLDKLKQDIFTWITEAYRVDRFNPEYGSTVSSYVGQQNTVDNAFAIRIEINRVLTNMQRYQRMIYSANRNAFSPSELLDRVLDVRTRPSLDALHVEILFTTAAHPESTYSTEVVID